MLKKIIKKIKNRNKEYRILREKQILLDRRKRFLEGGSEPWSPGYNEYKVDYIIKSINNPDFLKKIENKQLVSNYGCKLDERVIEYPWIFSKLDKNEGKLLDAGSTFNFDFIVNHPLLSNKKITILTFAPESNCFHNNGISYVYDDLRNIPFKDDLYDIIISQSTIEHIDMDNSIYGYDLGHNIEIGKKSFEYLKAIQEMIRVLKPKGQLLLTFPFGKFENHGFFQQFDDEMLSKIKNQFENLGTYSIDFFKYEIEGWCFSDKDELKNVISYNPHSGKGKLNDGAAHCRSVACIHFIKS